MSLSLEALSKQLGETLRERGLTLAVAESCTGGWIAKVVTDTAGSSGWFAGGLVTYSNDLKTKLLGVPRQMLESSGAVSEEVVHAMAEGACKAISADIAIAVSGVAGPEGGTPDKPVGTVWFAWRWPDGRQAEIRQFSGDRESIRRQAVVYALRQLIRHLSE